MVMLRHTADAKPDASVDVAYAQSLVAFDNDSTVTWTAATPLPPGLSISSAAISGTPTAPGTFSVTVTAGDSTDPTPATVSKVLQLKVLPKK